VCARALVSVCVCVISFVFSQLQKFYSKTAIRLFLLSCLVRDRARTGKTFWKPSIFEARDGIFLHVKIPGDIETAKQNKINCMYKKGLTIQPYILIIGSNLNNVHSFYIII